MNELSYPIYTIDPLYRVDMRCDGVVRWGYERMIERTAPYCEWHEPQYIEQLGMEIEAGWWMSKLALDGLMVYEWPQ